MAQSFINGSNLPLGLRNNNVGNLRPISVGTWEGQINVNGGFVVFKDVGWGIRAFATNLYTSINRYGTDTLRKYISRYAPESENKTRQYLDYITQKALITPDEKIPTDVDSIKKILRAQMEIEIGKQYADMVTEEDINEGLSRLSSPIASFFNAVGIYFQSNKKANYAVLGGALIAATGYMYYLYKKGIIKF